MKKILLAVVLFVSVGKLSAQHSEFAIAAGTIGSKLMSDSIDFRREVGIQFGLTADFFVKDNFSIRPGLMVKQKSSKYESNLLIDESGNIVDTLSESSTNEKINIGIQIPVLAHYHLNKYVGVYVGPSLELINGTVDYGINTGATIKVKRFEITLDYNQNFNDVKVRPEFGENRYNAFSMCLSFYFKQ